ncbi:MAG TPA: glycoside hydrolase family 16 protein, partial [Saprospiraceae bacterium]|nr:glycoside hydrolase family 16 protein [Saprospiraceae bacterium]
MLNRIIILAAVVGMALGCNPNEDYTLGDLTPPTNIAINAEIVGQTAATPNGDGSGDVKFTITADGALNYRIDYDAADGISLD